MTASAAILALSLTVRPPLTLVVEAERLGLPSAATGLRIEARPFTREWALLIPPAVIPATAFRLRGASRLCPEVTPGPDRVTLRCITSRVRATVVRDASGLGVFLIRLSVPPWRSEEEGPPLVPFDLARLGLGGCPGKTSEVQGECALQAGDLDTARARFQEAVRAGPSPLARLRLGDLALLDDDPDAAVAHWRLARSEAPWGRLASIRLCELEPKCLNSDIVQSVYDSTAVEHPLRADVVLHRARIAALGGELAEAARMLATESGPSGACRANVLWCRRVILQALELPGQGGMDVLSAYLELYGRREGPLAMELTRAAARQAERAGAPVFAANLLGSATGTIPGPDLEPHLRRVAELYLAGGDRARADEVVRYARSRLGEAAVRGPVWSALRRAVRTAPPAPALPPQTDDPDLKGAQAALDAARLVAPPSPSKGAKP